MSGPGILKRGPARLAVAVLALAALAACGGRGPDREGSSGKEGADASGQRTLPDTVEVVLGDYFIDMPDTIHPGVRALAVRNDGMHVHDLWVRLETGDSALAALSSPLDPGDARVLPLDLDAGRYYLNCQVANHEGRGMYHNVVVASREAGDG